MGKILTNFEHDTATVEFDLVTSLYLWLDNESLFGDVVRDYQDKRRLVTKPQTKTRYETNSTVAVSCSKFVRIFSIVLSFRLGH